MLRNNRVSTSVSSTTARRNQQSCQQCRKDKQKCSPSARDWKLKHEKCTRCVRLDHSCGPPLKSQKRSSNAVVSQARTDAMSRLVADCNILRIADHMVATQTCHSSPERYSEQSGVVALGCRSNVGLVRVESSMEHSEAVRIALARLADMNTAREMLLEARKYTDSVKLWFQEVSIFVQKLGVLIEDVETQFHRDIAAAIDNVGAGVEAESDIAVSAILQSHQRFSYPHILGGKRTTFAGSSHMQKILHLSRRMRKGATGDPVCGSTREIISGDDDKYNTVLAYMEASEAIMHVLETLDSSNRQSKANQYRRFSGDQIAYMYGNNNAALQLWSLCQETASSVDVLGRNLLHIVVHNSDHEMLRRILSLQGTYTTAIDATDTFGVTPLEIAICQDDPECFLLLMSHGAKQDNAFSKHGDSLIALAKRNDSSKILRLMFEAGAVLSESSPEACGTPEFEEQKVMSSTISHLASTASSPQERSRGQDDRFEQVNSLPIIMLNDFKLENSAPCSKLTKFDSHLSVLEYTPLLSFGNTDTWIDWPDFPDTSMDMQFAFESESVEIDRQ